jgi:signal peptidase I
MRHSQTFNAVIEDALRRGDMVRFRAEGASMYPTIRDGDTVTVAAVSARDVVRGDILLCRHEARVLAHRVVGVTLCDGELFFELRGDAKGGSDAPVVASAVLGRVLNVDRNGRLIELRGPAARVRRAARMALSRAWASLRHR